ncbi:hypothetical protein I79_017473 [Cricetulus griseus]|uniref:Uncharacterized protein n=1 Tax=Cricetulus griseus TaxID=10029 RepID=G3I237_CRIGR|nr:hypothetical protein I79_017473 [Cricetulus griseus]
MTEREVTHNQRPLLGKRWVKTKMSWVLWHIILELRRARQKASLHHTKLIESRANK